MLQQWYSNKTKKNGKNYSNCLNLSNWSNLVQVPSILTCHKSIVWLITCKIVRHVILVNGQHTDTVRFCYLRVCTQRLNGSAVNVFACEWDELPEYLRSGGWEVLITPVIPFQATSADLCCSDLLSEQVLFLLIFLFVFIIIILIFSVHQKPIGLTWAFCNGQKSYLA